MSGSSRQPRSPWWFTVLIVLALSPVFSLPAMLSACPREIPFYQAMVWLYPVAVSASGYYAWVSYRDRGVIAWIMLVFMVLVDASMCYLYLGNNIAGIM